MAHVYLILQAVKTKGSSMPCHVCATSLFVRFRELLGSLSRVLVGVLVLGALGAAPIPPEEIEKHMQSMGNAKIIQILERKQKSPGDPPDENELGLLIDDG